MRVRIIEVGTTKGEPVNRIFASLLSKAHESDAGKSLRLTTEAADVVHVLGPWTQQTCHAIVRQRLLDIPVVYTCTDGLQSIASLHGPTRTMKKIVKAASAIHVGGLTEQQRLSQWFPTTPTTLILNPLLTASTTEPEALSACTKLYERIVKSNQEYVKEQIQKRVDGLKQTDESIAAICHTMLYAQHFHTRGFLPKPLLQDLTHILITRDYDESQLAVHLGSLQISTFAARLMHILRQTTQLTEGFMPIPELDDKEAQAALSHILSTDDGLWWE